MVLAHLTSADSLDTLAREGFLTEVSREVIPTELVRRIVAWALDYFFASGRTVAPSKLAITDTFADQLEELEITIQDDVETDTIIWAVSDLRANHARIQSDIFTAAFAKEVVSVDGPERVNVFHRYSHTLFTIAQSLVSRRNELDGARGVEEALLRAVERQQSQHSVMGMTFGIPEIDGHMFGTHDGEITVVASGTGVGKSWLAGYTLINEWRMGRRGLLVTLENDVEMTYDRLCCIAVGIDYGRWQRGDVLPEQIERVQSLHKEMVESEHRPLIVQLDPVERTPSAIVRKAMLEGADSLIIDQLQFVRPDAGSRTIKRNEQVPEIMHKLKELVNEGTKRIPVLLFVQVNRDGVSSARKTGRYFKEHMAESSAVEQVADAVWAIFQSQDLEILGMAEFQQLKARRTPVQHFEVMWQPWVGLVRVTRTVDLAARQAAA